MSTMDDKDAGSAAHGPLPGVAAGAPPSEPPSASEGGLLGIIERLANRDDPPIEIINRLLEQKRMDEDRAAIRAFNRALSRAKGEVGPIFKTHEVDFQTAKGRTKYKHEEFADIAREIDPVLARHGLSYRFSVAQEKNEIAVSCILSHEDGYSERTEPLLATIDQAGSNMNPLQALGSALTYLQRYQLRAALGLAAGKDDDARSLSGGKINAEQVAELTKLLNETGRSPAMILRLYGADAIEDMTVEQFNRTCDVLAVSKAERGRNATGQ